MFSVFLGRFLFPGAIPLSNLLAGNVSLEIVRDSLVEYFFRYILVVIPLHFFWQIRSLQSFLEELSLQSLFGQELLS